MLKAPTKNSYKSRIPAQQVYEKPSMWIGSTRKNRRNEWVYSFKDSNMYKKMVEVPAAVERLFLEGITNASDNCIRTRDAEEDPGKIVVTMNNKRISILNEGFPIPVDRKEDDPMIWIPEMLFGDLFSSSNYLENENINAEEVDEDSEEENQEELETHAEESKNKGPRRKGAGTNGVGAKAMNIFSLYFQVIIHDPHPDRKRIYSQIWRNNMKTKEEAIITENYQRKESTVEIIYEIEFEKFGYKNPEVIGNIDEEIVGGYPIEVFEMFARHCCAISSSVRVPIHFNGIVFQCENIKEYARLHYGDKVENGLIYYKWPEGTDIYPNKLLGTFIAKDKNVVPIMEFIILDSPDEGEHISYINCMIAREGGCHMDSVWNKVGRNIITTLNAKIMKMKNKNVKISIHDIKPHITIVGSFHAENPEFDSQSKAKLIYPLKKYFTKDIMISKQSFKITETWNLYDRLLATFEAKTDIMLKNTDGKLAKYLVKTSKREDKIRDANFAGDRDIRKRMACVFYICEGDSASIYLDTKISMIPSGKDTYGYMPARGKGLNVLNAKNDRIAENEEIALIKKYLGLKEDMDYTIDANYHTLRYGRLCVITDSDDDGNHINALILLYFKERFPSLIKRGFFTYEKTPIVRAKKGKEKLDFYLTSDYEQWKETHESKGWKCSFYKGLASSDDKDIIDDIKRDKIIKIEYDDRANHTLELAFHRNFSDQRKEWISNKYITATEFSGITTQSISDFINNDYIHYGIKNLGRSIPNLMDGLKISQRKILYTVYEEWNIKSNKKEKYEKCKVAQFQGTVSKLTAYQHGEQNLEGTIIKMARNFPGTNNISLLKPEGQFGSRMDEEKKPSGRYVYITPRKILSHIFRDEDKPLLKHSLEEDKIIEPEMYLPIIPMVLVNGCRGVAIGFNTFIPNFNPLQVIDWLKQRILDTPSDEITEVNPWYFGHTGIIKIIDRRDKKKRNGKVKVTVIKNKGITTESTTKETNDVYTDDISVFSMSDDDVQEVIQEQSSQRPLLTMVSFGEYHVSDGKIIITELPVGVWSNDYENYLDTLIQSKKIKTKYSQCTKEKVYFEIEGFQGPINFNTLKLRRSYGMSNMLLIDEHSHPTRYDTQYEILESFYEQRLPYFYNRKKIILSEKENRLDMLLHKMKFLNYVINEDFDFKYFKKAETIQKLEEAGVNMKKYPELIKLTFESFSNEKKDSLTNKIDLLRKEIEVCNSTTAEELWLENLEELRTEYLEYLKIENKMMSKGSNAYQRSKPERKKRGPNKSQNNKKRT